MDPGPASGLGASRPRLALRLSLGLSAELLSGRLLTESDLVVGSRKVVPESAGLCWVTLTCNTSIFVRGFNHMHFSPTWKILYFFIKSSSLKTIVLLFLLRKEQAPPNREARGMSDTTSDESPCKLSLTLLMTRDVLPRQCDILRPEGKLFEGKDYVLFTCASLVLRICLTTWQILNIRLKENPNKLSPCFHSIEYNPNE